MAVNANKSGEAVDASKRFAIGANVALSVIVAAALLVAINWIASLKHWRKDLATVGNYGLSDRTRTILDGAKGDIELSIVYEPNDKDKNQKEYISRLQEYCDELAGYTKRFKVTHVATDRQREQLVADISGSVGGEAGAHKEAIEAFQRLRTELEAELTQRTAEAVAIQSNRDAWLSGFPMFAQVVLTLQEMQKKVVALKGEIEELTPQSGLPKYGEAATKAKEAVEELTTGFKKISTLMRQFTSLSQETTRPDSEYIQALGEVAAAARGVASKLRTAVGNEGDEVPADVKAPLKAFADACVEAAGTLDALVSRVERFADAFPIVQKHADWSAQIQSGPLPLQIGVDDVLQETGRNLEKLRLQILGILDKADPNELQAALLGVRRNTSGLEQNIAVCDEILTSLANGLSKMDGESQALLDAAGSGGLFATTIASLETTKKQFDELPELTLGDIADKLREPNTIVVKYNKELRVIGFDEIWPIRQGPADSDNDEPSRSFNGDSAIGSAILAVTADRKFANIVFVGYEPPAPQQRSPFMPPPPRSSIPLEQTNLLRERLVASNYNVYQWNLAQQPDAPTMEDGLKTIHVFLPPAPPAAPNPFGPQTPQASFGDAERAKVREMLSQSGRAIFLAGWEVMASPFGGPPTTPEYGYNPILESEFGLHVDNGTRIIKVVPDTKTERGFTLSLPMILWLPTFGYSDSPIGKSMRGTRSLANSACVIDITDPPGDATVNVDSILRIPDREEYIGTSTSELMSIFSLLNDPKANSNVIQLEKRPTASVTAKAEADADGDVSLPLGFVPPLKADAALLTINGYKFRAPIVSAESHLLEIPESAMKDAGVKVGDAIDLEVSITKNGEPVKKVVKTTIEREPGYRVMVPRRTLDDLAGYVRDDEYPVRVNLNNHEFVAQLRSSEGDTWIPVTEKDKSAAKLEAGATADVAIRIVGLNDRYYPQKTFTSALQKVEKPKLVAKLTFDPLSGSRMRRLQIDVSIGDHAFKAQPMTIGGDYRARVFQHDLSSAEAKAGQTLQADIEFIVGEEPSPFNLVVGARRSNGKNAAKTDDTTGPPAMPQETDVVVMSIGQSYTDAFLTQPVTPTFNQIRLDPPPTENLDLFVNAVHSLNGTSEYIGRGPVPVPRIEAISSSDQTKIRLLLFGAWPALVLAPGIVLWFMRRR